MRIERLGAGDAAKVAQASALFDGPARADATRRFLGEPGHHLLIAHVGDPPVGFVTGVELTHPDKGTEMFLYELGVAEAHRRRGIGKALATYQAAGAAREPDTVMLGWEFPSSHTSDRVGHWAAVVPTWRHGQTANPNVEASVVMRMALHQWRAKPAPR